MEMCRDLEYDALVLTDTHDKGSLSSSKHFITADKASDNDPFAGVAILLSDKLAKCVRHTGYLGSDWCVPSPLKQKAGSMILWDNLVNSLTK